MSVVVSLVGNITRDAEVIPVKGGSIVKFSVATRRAYRKKDEEEVTDFFEVSSFIPEGRDERGKEASQKLMDMRVPELRKGLHISIIEGANLQIDKWDDRATGEKRSKPSIFVRSLWSINYDRKSVPTVDEDVDIPF